MSFLLNVFVDVDIKSVKRSRDKRAAAQRNRFFSLPVLYRYRHLLLYFLPFALFFFFIHTRTLFYVHM